jgi:hypothetical protein
LTATVTVLFNPAVQTFESHAGHPGEARWVYFGRDIQRFYDLKSRLARWGDPIDSGPLIDEISREVRSDFINLDRQLDVNISDLRWQSSDVAERNPFSSDLFYHCSLYIAFDSLMNDNMGNLVVIVEDWYLGWAMWRHAKNAGRAARFVSRGIDFGGFGPYVQWCIWRIRLVKQSILSRFHFIKHFVSLKRRPAGLERSRERHPGADDLGAVDVCLTTWGEPETFPPSGEKETDDFFGILPMFLKKRGLKVQYLLNPIDWIHNPTIVVQNAKERGGAVILPVDCAGWLDALRAAVTSFFQPWRLKSRFVINGVDLSDLVRDEGRRDLTKALRQSWGMLYFCVGRFLRDKGLRPRVVLHPFENQPWEKALRLGLKRYLPDAEIVAYQHAPFPALWMGAFPSSRDIEENQLPDKLIVLGPAWMDIFSNHGYPPDVLVSGPALRFGHLFQDSPDGERPNDRTDPYVKTILTAASIGRNDAFELAHKTVEAFKADDSVRVLLKFHPRMGSANDIHELIRRILDSLGLDQLPRNFEIVTDPIDKILPLVDLVLHTGTSVAVEAWAKGVPTLLVKPDLWLDMDNLSLVDDTAGSARTPLEVRTTAWKVMLREGGRASESVCKQRLEKGFADVTTVGMEMFVERARSENPDSVKDLSV